MQQKRQNPRCYQLAETTKNRKTMIKEQTTSKRNYGITQQQNDKNKRDNNKSRNNSNNQGVPKKDADLLAALNVIRHTQPRTTYKSKNKQKQQTTKRNELPAATKENENRTWNNRPSRNRMHAADAANPRAFSLSGPPCAKDRPIVMFATHTLVDAKNRKHRATNKLTNKLTGITTMNRRTQHSGQQEDITNKQAQQTRSIEQQTKLRAKRQLEHHK